VREISAWEQPTSFTLFAIMAGTSSADKPRVFPTGASIDTSQKGLEINNNEYKGARVFFGSESSSTPAAAAAAGGAAAATMPSAAHFRDFGWGAKVLSVITDAQAGVGSVSVEHCAEAVAKAAVDAMPAVAGDHTGKSTQAAVAAQARHTALVTIIHLAEAGKLEASPAGGATGRADFAAGTSVWSHVVANPNTTLLTLPDLAPESSVGKKAKKDKKEKKSKKRSRDE